ncbi:hypothetical protein TNCV_1184631 [Trichonephila clavipes]|nr:hypothetical protein TNCV_1184631 [Trichonephila clavipes]
MLQQYPSVHGHELVTGVVEFRVRNLGPLKTRRLQEIRIGLGSKSSCWYGVNVSEKGDANSGVRPHTPDRPWSAWFQTQNIVPPSSK